MNLEQIILNRICVVKTYTILNKMSRVYIVNSMLALTLTLFLQVQFNGE